MRITLSLTLVVVCAAPALAQEAPAKQPPDPSLAAWNELQKEFRKASDEFYRPWREAQKKGEKYELDYTKHPNRTFAPRFKEFAEKHLGTESAANAWALVLRLGPNEQDKELALERLLEDHMQSKSMKGAIFGMRYLKPKGPAAIARVAKESPHAEVRGFALLTHGQSLKTSNPKEAKRIFQKVLQEYSDQPYFGKATLGGSAAGEIFEMERLSVGQTAPEISGTDIAGDAFKLSDYRGKVILLDFWGDW